MSLRNIEMAPNTVSNKRKNMASVRAPFRPLLKKLFQHVVYRLYGKLQSSSFPIGKDVVRALPKLTQWCQNLSEDAFEF